MKTQKQIKDSCNLCFASYVGMIILIFALLCAGCSVTSHTNRHSCELMERGQACLSDHSCCEYGRNHTTEIYYNGIDVYWGYHSGFYYYYGMPHYYPWWNYYHICPPYYYNTTTHIVINKPVNKPTHRPNWNKPNTNITVKPNKNKVNVIVKPNKNNVKINRTNTKVNVNKNRSNNTKVNMNRRKPR